MKYKIALIILILSSVFFACGDKPLFTELSENRVTVIIKGTYESNNPAGWLPMDSHGLEDRTYDDSEYFLHSNPAEDEIPDVFMLDIAGMKVAAGNDHEQYFANYRKTFTSPMNDTCDFFNGTGYTYKNTDMRPDFTWDAIHMYIRKMIYNNAKQYQPLGVSDWLYEEDVEVIFQEEDAYGVNFNLFQTLTYYDYLKENYDEVNRVFPLKIPVEDGFIFDYDEEETVLEIRLVVKNFIKKYEYEYENDDDERRLRHFYALSDWLRYIEKNEAEDGLMGGNVITAARYWVPGKTATITGSGIPANRYVIAIKSSHSISEYCIPDRTRPACDAPKTPWYPNNDGTTDFVEALLDYYLEYETYKEDYDTNFYPCVAETEVYETDWDDYNTRIKTFKIPQLITSSDGTGNFTFENVPEGTYNIYYATDSPAMGELPDLSSHTLIGSGIQVTEDDFDGTVTVPQP
ncbi:MAG: hypothetical protein JW864_14080 [Spirochaetes bacterium]|nr:hypothetical protein [Spirochaetota bacterium]